MFQSLQTNNLQLEEMKQIPKSVITTQPRSLPQEITTKVKQQKQHLPSKEHTTFVKKLKEELEENKRKNPNMREKS